MDLTATRGTARDYRISEHATPTPSADHIVTAVCFGSYAGTQCEKVPVATDLSDRTILRQVT
jgi:hypothetical protein